MSIVYVFLTKTDVVLKTASVPVYQCFLYYNTPKVIMAFMCFVLYLSFVSCNNTENQNEEMRECFNKVLEEE